MSNPTTIDEYLEPLSPKVKEILQKIRGLVHEAVPAAVETISYQLPTFKLDGKSIVHFAAWEDHIGFYPLPSGVVEFEKELTKYASGKGSVKFPLNEPIPFDLISKIIAFRIEEVTRIKNQAS